MGSDPRDDTLSFIKVHGPSVPTQIAKELRSNTLLASAVLSELAGKGQLKISKLKVGSSPLYYVQGQEDQLLRFTASLGEKDRRTIELLQERKVLRDADQDPLTRVSLRNVPDFAVQLTVTLDGKTEIFWKWFLVPDAELHGLIAGLLHPPSVQQPPIQPVAPAVHPPRPSVKSKKSARKRPAAQKPLVTEPVAPVVSQPRDVETLEPPVVPVPSQSSQVQRPGGDVFFDSVSRYFTSNKIELVEHEVVRKGLEHDFVVRVPSPVGFLFYYCKAKAKQRLSDLDVSAAFAQGQLRKLPVLLLAPGESSEKAVELAQRLKCVTLARLPGA